jgi:hypothetical protein
MEDWLECGDGRSRGGATLNMGAGGWVRVEVSDRKSGAGAPHSMWVSVANPLGWEGMLRAQKRRRAAALHIGLGDGAWGGGLGFFGGASNRGRLVVD